MQNKTTERIDSPEYVKATDELWIGLRNEFGFTLPDEPGSAKKFIDIAFAFIEKIEVANGVIFDADKASYTTALKVISEYKKSTTPEEEIDGVIDLQCWIANRIRLMK